MSNAKVTAHRYAIVSPPARVRTQPRAPDPSRPQKTKGNPPSLAVLDVTRAHNLETHRTVERARAETPQ